MCVNVGLFLLSSLTFLQIGTGFKDEDLEQHYKFLKVRDCCSGQNTPVNIHYCPSSAVIL